MPRLSVTSLLSAIMLLAAACGGGTSAVEVAPSSSSSERHDLASIERPTKVGARPPAVTTPAGDLTVSEEDSWVRFSGPGLTTTQTADTITLTYQDQSAEFFLSDIRLEGNAVMLKRGSTPISANGEQLAFESSEKTTRTFCQCSQCIFFLEYCCLPNTNYIGLCLGVWDCRAFCGF